MQRRPLIVAAVLDIVSIIVFVAIGRNNHDEGGGAVHGTLSVAAPFLIALAVGWLLARAWRAPLAPATGIIVWLTTIIVGMPLRHWAFHRGTATAFIIVATLFTGVFLVGWRVVGEKVGAHRNRR
jgi:hypothetical protein